MKLRIAYELHAPSSQGTPKDPAIDYELLELELGAFHRRHQFSTTDEAASILRESPDKARAYPHVTRLVDWLLCVPVASAEAERSFSKLRRVKSWLRSTMTESRLSDLLVCHVHQRLLDKVDVSRVMKSFIVTDDNRRRAFGDV